MKKTKQLAKIITLIITIMLFASTLAFSSSAASLSAPSKVTSSSSTTAIKLSWSKVKEATGYRIYYKLPGDISWRTGLKSTTKTTYTFKDLPEGQHYTFAVRSYKKESGKTTWGSYKQIKAATQTPAPKNITAEQTTTVIKLKWSSVKSADGYRVYYKTSASADWKTAVSSTTKTSYTIKNLTAGQKYYFAVKTYSKSSLGTFYGKSKSIKTATKPKAPTLKASAEKTSITLSWSKVKSTGYRVYYKTSSSASWKTAVSSTVKNTYTLKKLTSGKKYILAVRAYVKSGSETYWSDYSQITATTKSTVKVPSSKAEIAAAYNKAFSDLSIYNGKLTVKKTEDIDIEITDCPEATEAVINNVAKDLSGTTTKTYTFENNRDISEPSRILSEILIPWGRDALVQPEGLASASAKANSDGSYTMKMTFVAEDSVFDGTETTGPIYHKSAMDILEFETLDLGAVEITNANIHYPGATITATIDSNGRIIKLVNELPVETQVTVKAIISISIGMNVSIDTTYKFTYK